MVSLALGGCYAKVCRVGSVPGLLLSLRVTSRMSTQLYGVYDRDRVSNEGGKRPVREELDPVQRVILSSVSFS